MLNNPVNLPISSFNPCSIGNCSGREGFYRFQGFSPWFQSLFYWKLLWKLQGLRLWELSPPVSILVLLEIALEVKFKMQIGVSDYFVSILVLLEIALEDVDYGICFFLDRKCFNPCSIGNCSGSTQRRHSTRLVTTVSILVLLEIALEAVLKKVFYFLTTTVSILVLLEIALEVLRGIIATELDLSFNPCSIGNCSGRRERRYW